MTPTLNQKERRIRLYFDVSVIGKGLISLAEIIAGIAALFIPTTVISNLVIAAAQSEVFESPHDVVANFLSQQAHQFAFTSSTFIAVYLLSRGIIKLGLVAALLRNQLWAYPSSLVVLGLFVVYQVYQYATGHSLLIVLLTVFDLIVMYFIWREWQILRSNPQLRR